MCVSYTRIVTSLFTLGKHQPGWWSLGSPGVRAWQEHLSHCSWSNPRQLQPPVEPGDSEEETTERLEKLETHISPPRRSGYERAQEAAFWLQENKLCQGRSKTPPNTAPLVLFQIPVQRPARWREVDSEKAKMTEDSAKEHGLGWATVCIRKVTFTSGTATAAEMYTQPSG